MDGYQLAQVAHISPLFRFFASPIAFERGTQRPDQEFVIDGLPHKGQRPGRQGLIAHPTVIVGRDKDDREPVAAPHQLLLHLQSVQSRHLDIEHNTVDG